MPEKPSRTSNHQRLNEMMCHLTPQKALVPYNVCFDLSGNLWVASKGGLFKFDPSGRKLLFHLKNEFPKKISAYPQIILHKTKLVYVTGDSELIQFRILDQEGKIEHEHFVDGKVQSLAITEQGDLFMTKQLSVGAEESTIWKSNIDCPMAWEEFCSSFDECFQNICSFDNSTLAVAVVSLPVNIYSKQSIKWLDTSSGKFTGRFSSAGKLDGQVFFPRCMRPWRGDSLLVMDKTGRLQKFDRNGAFIEVSAKIDDYIGNGFVLSENSNEAIIACSGIVLDEKGESICDDWIEAIKLDGSKWTPAED